MFDRDSEVQRPRGIHIEQLLLAFLVIILMARNSQNEDRQVISPLETQRTGFLENFFHGLLIAVLVAGIEKTKPMQILNFSKQGVRIMKFNVLWIAGLIFAATTAPAFGGGVLSLNYTTTSIGGGLYKYDFELSVTNQDSSYFVGQNFNWIIFGDVNNGVSPISDFVLLSETFSNPNMNLTSSNGFHNGPTWLDTTNFFNGGWIPTGVGDSVTWSGKSSNNVTSGLLFSNLVGNGNHSDFELATYRSSAVPEPASMALWSLGALGILLSRRRRRQMQQAV